MIEVYVKGNEDYESNGDMTLTPTTCEVELILKMWKYWVNTKIMQKHNLQ